jgi:surface polysaccharide O-acyltransferase-like enzyme
MDKIAYNRNCGLELMKFILAVSVILLHYSDVFWIVDGFSRIAVPFFIFVSGYYSYDMYKRKNGNLSFRDIAKFTSPFVIMYCVWMLVYGYYSYIDIFQHINKSSHPIVLIAKLLYLFLWAEGYFHLWYLLAMIQAIVLFWLLKKYNITDKILLILAVILFGVGLIRTTYSSLFADSIWLRLLNTICSNGFSVALPMYIFGYLLHGIRITFKASVQSLMAVLCLYCVEFLLVHYFVPNSSPTLFITHLFIIPALFLSSLSWNIPSKFMAIIGLSAEIYFVHPLVHNLYMPFSCDVRWINVMVIIVLSIIVAYLIHPYCYKLSRLFK